MTPNQLRSEYDPTKGTTHTLTVPKDNIKELAFDGSEYRIIFDGTTETGDVLSSSYVTKEKLIQLLERRESALIAEKRRYLNDSDAYSAYVASMRAQEIHRLLLDVEIDEIDIP